MRRQLDYSMVTPTLQAAAWVHPRRLILSDHQQVIMRLGRPEGPWRGTRVSYNLKSGNRSHQRKPHTTGTGATAAALRARFLQQSRIRRGGDGHAGAVHHDDVTALEGQTQKSRGKTRLGRDLKGEATGKDTRAAQARAHNLHNPRRKTARQELIKTQRDLQGEEERPHGQETEGGERGDH